jgi:uncharacterized protein (DUF2237 family)
MTKASGISSAENRSECDVGIVFSLRDGLVWASWPDTEVSVRLGRHDMVASMMRDFLAQDALGRRLSARKPGGGLGPSLPDDRR